jgi:hypothetical protein
MPWVNGSWEGPEPSVGELAGGDPPQCGCCGSSGVPLSVYRLDGGTQLYREASEHGEPPYHALCGLCAGTMTGKWHQYPHQHDGDALETMKVACHVGNAVLKALAAQKDGGRGTR